MPMSRRSKRRNSGGEWYSLHALPFLSIMLGLISVMALNSMAITVQKREAARKEELVRLANIPENLIPVQVVCDKDTVEWEDKNGKTKRFYVTEPTGPLKQTQHRGNVASTLEFFQFLKNLERLNRQSSFEGRQRTLILWVKPKGGETATQIQALLLQLGLPIRVGKLPLLGNEHVNIRGAEHVKP